MIPPNSHEFPHDRVVYFSDAVFAIAITLLVIEIKVPSHEVIHDLGMEGSLRKLIPLFIGYVVSFLVSALFWKSHLELYKYVDRVDTKMIWMNIFLLLFVALMPFSTALFSENFSSNTAFAFYCTNLAAIGIVNWLMYNYSSKLGFFNNLANARWFKIRPLIVPFVFLICIPLAFLSPLMSRFGFLLIFIFQAIGQRIWGKQKAQSL
jgi:uncharacterized membrane protein